MWVKVLIFHSLLLGYALSDNDSKCDISNITSNDWSLPLMKTTSQHVDVKDNLLVSSYTGKINIQESFCSICGSDNKCTNDYLKTSTNESDFLISYTENMKNIDDDMIKYNCKGTIFYKTDMTCQTELNSSLIVQLQVNDWNDYPPEISHGVTTYKVPSPVMPKSDIIIYGDKISATDKDFSTTAITFKVSPDDFDVITTVDSSTKPATYYATFESKRVLPILESGKKYTITATDDGKDPGPKTSDPLEILLIPDNETSLDIPSFVYEDGCSSYNFQYKDDNLTVLNCKISVNTAKPIDAANSLTLTGDFAEHFTAKYNTATSEVDLSVKTKIEDPTSSYIILTLGLKTDLSITAPILIYFTSVPVDTGPKFTEHVYIGNYDDSKNAVNLEQKIKVITTSTNTPKVNISGDLSNKFEVTPDTDTNTYKVIVKTPLTPAEIKSKEYLLLNLEATVDSESDTSGLIITLPTHKLEFTQVLYSANYNENNTVSVDETQPINFKTDASDISISVEDKYSKYFNLTYKDKKCELAVIKALSEDILKAETEISVIVTAKDKYDNEANAVIKIALPHEDDTEPPNFSDPYYTIQYKEGQTGIIDFDKAVSFDNVDDMTKINITLSNYTGNFEVVYDSDKWRLKIVSPLSDKDFSDSSELITTMAAREKDVVGNGIAVLVIRLIESEKPKFKEVYYKADYPKSGSGSFDFDNDLTFEHINDLTKVNVKVLNYTNNFNIEYNNSEKRWKITISRPLAQTLLDSNSYITAKLTAKIDGSTYSPETAFILSLPEKKPEVAPIFTKSYYNANYAINGSTAVVTFDDNIGFTNKDDMSKIRIVSDEFSSYFTFKYETKNWHLISNGILNADILNRTDLVVAVTATDITNKLEGHSVIDLKLPSVNSDGAPKFSKTYYKGRYEMTGSKSLVTLDEDIGFFNKADMADITITTDQYKDNFNFSYNGKWSVTVLKNLDSSVLNSKIDIVMALIATENSKPDEIGQSALILTLPTINDDGAPKFSEIVYESACNSTTTILDAEIKIKDKKDLRKINMTFLEDDYKSNFDIAFDSTKNSWFITVKSMPDLLEGKKDLVLTLTATEAGKIGQAALVIYFPVLSTPIFSKEQYYGNYTLGAEPQFEIEDFAILNKGSDVALNFSSTDGDFSDNFNITYDGKSNLWKMSLKTNIDDTKLTNKSTIILTLTAKEVENDNIGKATIIIYLTNNNEGSDIDFTQVHYTGSYENSVDPTVVKLDKNIQVTSKKDSAAAVVNITGSDDFDALKYFELTKNSDYYEVKVLQPLSQEILQKQKSLVMTLEADLDDSKKYATLVVELPPQASSNPVKFENPLYNGEYKIEVDGTVTFTVDTVVLVTDDHTGDVRVDISEGSTYGKYFELNRTGNNIQVVKTAALPKDIYTKETVIPLILEAGIIGSTTKASTVVDIKINYDSYLGSVQFSNVLYNGIYEISKKVVTIKVDPINLITDKADQIDVLVSNVYSKYFEAKYNSTNSQVTVTKILNIPNSILDDTTTVSILLDASIKTATAVSSSSVVNLRIINDDAPDPDVTGTIAFNAISNTAKYSVENNKGNLKIDKIIGVTTDRMVEEIVPDITDDLGLSAYFNSSYNEQAYSVKLVKDLPEDIFLSKSFISLTLTATIKNTSQIASAVLTIEMDNQNKPGLNGNKSNYKPYIIAISFLSVFIVLFIIAAILLYYFKLRNSSKYEKMTEEEYMNRNSKVKFDKTASRQSGDMKKRSSALEQRRPTAFIFKQNPTTDENDEPRESNSDPEDLNKEPRKSVAFDDNVEKLQIDLANDDDEKRTNNI